MFSKQELNKLFRYACSLTHDEQSAFDILQAAIVRVLPKSPENPVAYTKTAIRNLFLDQKRYEKKIEMEELPSEIIDINTDFETILIQKDELNSLLSKISTDERELLYLWAVEEMTFAEIADELNQKRGTLLSRMSRLRTKIVGLGANDEKTS